MPVKPPKNGVLLISRSTCPLFRCTQAIGLRAALGIKARRVPKGEETGTVLVVKGAIPGRDESGVLNDTTKEIRLGRMD